MVVYSKETLILLRIEPGIIVVHIQRDAQCVMLGFSSIDRANVNFRQS